MFDKGTRTKVRFDSPQGLLTLEDLWDLPLTSNRSKANLDDIARGLYKQIKESDVASFVDDTKAADEVIQLKFELVKHVIDVKKAENAAVQQQRANAEKKQQILALIAQKENEQLAGQSLDELKTLAASL